ncbi:MAG: hypothetical protein H6922_04830 [Pseudomonadaceae bacterium]|nr:hypothetical protein [Pseudomonadaceae bacterium]
MAKCPVSLGEHGDQLQLAASRHFVAGTAQVHPLNGLLGNLQSARNEAAKRGDLQCYEEVEKEIDTLLEAVPELRAY